MPSRTELFIAYVQIGLSGFGGVNAWARRFFVEKKGWLTEQEYAAALGIGQVLPGANSLNTAVGIGAHFHGATGAVICGVGLFAGPMILLAAIASLYDAYGQLPLVRAILTGIAAAAAGMVMGTACKMATRLRPTLPLLGIGLAALVLAVLRVPMPYILLGLAPLGFYFAWRSLRS